MRYTLAQVLKSYVPALVVLALGIGVGLAFTTLNSLLGPKRPSKTKSDPYESGLPSEVRRSFRFGVSFYLAALSAVETAARQLKEGRVEALSEAITLSRESQRAFMA